jgi:hypothetical protein
MEYFIVLNDSNTLLDSISYAALRLTTIFYAAHISANETLPRALSDLVLSHENKQTVT